MPYIRPILTAVVTIMFVQVLVVGWMMSDKTFEEPALAQETGTCPDAQLIDIFEGNGDQQTDTFDTTTNSFRVSYEVTGSDPEFPANLFVDIIDADDPDQLSVADATQDGDGSGETFVNSPAGTYFLDISFLGGEYTITVEQCEGDGASSNPGGEEKTSASNPQPDPQPKPSPKPQKQDRGNGDLLRAGGSQAGPVPVMPSGECPEEFPEKRLGACHG